MENTQNNSTIYNTFEQINKSQNYSNKQFKWLSMEFPIYHLHIIVTQVR